MFYTILHTYRYKATYKLSYFLQVFWETLQACIHI